MNKKTFVVKENIKLSKAIINNLPYFSFNKAKSVIRNKDVKVNGKRVSYDCELQVGDSVEAYYEDSKTKTCHYNLVYEDDNIIVVNKHSGIETINEKGDSLYDELKIVYPTIKAVHRLDRNTCGLVIFAKNELSEKELLAGFKNKTITKVYNAVVQGKPPKKHDTMTAYLVKDASNSLVKIFDKNVKSSQKIITEYEVLAYKNNKSLLSVTLHTGKTHQIRAHFAHIGCCLVGDGKYGVSKKGESLNLVAVSLSFNMEQSSPLSYLNQIKIELDRELYPEFITKF